MGSKESDSMTKMSQNLLSMLAIQRFEVRNNVTSGTSGHSEEGLAHG